MDQEYFTPAEVAEKLKVTRAAVNKWIAQRRLECVYVGSDRRITSAAIDAFVKASTEARRSKIVRTDGLGDTIEEDIEAPLFTGVVASLSP